ncbi:hypothetical protein L2E82_36428 [Cichorium intybus]|uniref:Uncharacterized protein n=1 Tax=Cichorium intybus TaxID=13427 RepID=A0ACB9BRP4_CICIN|nr:hypothetical protein L2E82_36428 [Cichorium intybus]
MEEVIVNDANVIQAEEEEESDGKKNEMTLPRLKDGYQLLYKDQSRGLQNIQTTKDIEYILKISSCIG